MKKQFVTYEIAKKLKELGFNEPCFAYFFADTNELYESTVRMYNFNKGLETYAPLWQQAIDWLREEHLLYLNVYRVSYFHDEAHCWSLKYINNYARFHRDYPVDKAMCGVKEKDFYTARQKGIEEALKVISKP